MTVRQAVATTFYALLALALAATFWQVTTDRAAHATSSPATVATVVTLTPAGVSGGGTVPTQAVLVGGGSAAGGATPQAH